MNKALHIQPGNVVGAYRVDELLPSLGSQRIRFRGRREWAVGGGAYSKLGLGFGGQQIAGGAWLVEVCLPGDDVSQNRAAMERLRKLNRADLSPQTIFETVLPEGSSDEVTLMAQCLSDDLPFALNAADLRTALREIGAALAAAHDAGIAWGGFDRWHLARRDGHWKLLPSLSLSVHKRRSAVLKKAQNTDVVALLKYLVELSDDAASKTTLNRWLLSDIEMIPTAAELAVVLEQLPPMPPALESGGICAGGHMLCWEADLEMQVRLVRLMEHAPALSRAFLTEELERRTQTLSMESPVQLTIPCKEEWRVMLVSIHGEVARPGPVRHITWLPDVTDVEAWRDGSHVQLRWKWPLEVKLACVVLKITPDHLPPQHAIRLHFYRIFKSPILFEILLPELQHSKLYFQVFSAAHQGGNNYLFSPGLHPGCQTELEIDSVPIF